MHLLMTCIFQPDEAIQPPQCDTKHPHHSSENQSQIPKKVTTNLSIPKTSPILNLPFGRHRVPNPTPPPPPPQFASQATSHSVFHAASWRGSPVVRFLLLLYTIQSTTFPPPDASIPNRSTPEPEMPDARYQPMPVMPIMPVMLVMPEICEPVFSKPSPTNPPPLP